MSNKSYSCAKIGIIHPQLTEGGGSEAAASYMAEALMDKYDLSLISKYIVSFDKLNEYYGTNLGSVVEIIDIPFQLF